MGPFMMWFWAVIFSHFSEKVTCNDKLVESQRSLTSIYRSSDQNSFNKQDLFFKNTNETGQAETELENRWCQGKAPDDQGLPFKVEMWIWP